MKRLQQIIEADETPAAAFDRQARVLDTLLNDIRMRWTAKKLKLKQQVQKNPTDWSGIGKGSELADLIQHLTDAQHLVV